MIRLPPRSTLFPYTTLFRSKPNIDYCRMKYPNLLFYPRNYSPEINKLLSFMASTPQKPRCYGVFRFIAIPIQQIHKNMRSEEHTSELQSRPHLVCRLLLEKK